MACAPTAWPEFLRSTIASWMASKAARGSWTPTGSGAHIAATRLPSAPRSASARTETGTIARSTTPSVGGRARASSARWRATPSQDGVVDGAAEGVLDRLDVVDVGVDPRVAPVRPDRDVERRGGRRVQARRGPSRPGRPPGRRAAGPRARARAARPARRGRSRPGTVTRSTSASARSWVAVGGGAGSQARRGRRRGRVGAGVEEDRRDVDARDAVDQGVVGLRDHRSGSRPCRREALDDVHLPERLGAVELLGEEPAAEGRELLVGAGRGQGAVAHVVADVEVRVVDPHRPSLAERHEGQALAVAGDEVQPALDRGDRVVVGGRRRPRRRGSRRRACARRPSRGAGSSHRGRSGGRRWP